MKINKLTESKKLKEGYSHFEFTSGANPYIAKTKDEAERIKRSRGDSARYIGNVNGIDYYKVDDSEEDSFRVDESKQLNETEYGKDELWNQINNNEWAYNSLANKVKTGIENGTPKERIVYIVRNAIASMRNDFGRIPTTQAERLELARDFVEDELQGYSFEDGDMSVPSYKRTGTWKRLGESFKPSDSGIQSVKCYNRYNYTIQELRVDNDNKTFERGNFTAGKADKKTKNRQEFEDIVDTLKELGYTEIKSDYRSMRNKSRKGVMQEDASYEWKPNTSFKHIKDIYNKVKANGYKYANNEREEFMAAVKKADNKGYKPEERRQIKDWHRDIWSHNRKMEEGYELSPRIDYNPNHLRDDEGKIMADRWYASKWPDDEVGIEQLQGITLDDALKDRSILGHCDTQVRERVYAQLDKYSPMILDVKELDDGKKWQYSIGGKDVPYTSYEEAKAHMKDDYKIIDYRDELQEYIDNETGRPHTFFVDETFDGRLVISINWGDWKHEHGYADYLVKKFFMDKGLGIEIDEEVTDEDGSDTYSADHYYDINDISFSGRVVNESKESEESELITGFQKEFYNGYVILKNRAGDGWDIYSYDGTPEKVTKAYLEDEGYATLEDAKAEIDRLNKESDSMNEASYGGAFDIADDQYFTREDLENAAGEVLSHIQETFSEPYHLGGTWFEDGKWIVNVQGDQFDEYEISLPVDMRKIKEPWHLKRAYANEMAAKLIGQIKEYNGLNEDTAVPSTFEFDDDVDDLTYYYEDEEFRRALDEEPYNEIASKQVPDSSGFLTDYTMYQNMNTGEYVFVFGDKDIYRPEDGYFDWECETEEEAKEWFDNYVGFDDDLVDESWNSKLEEETETSPIVHKKSDGSYLVQSENGDGYTAFNKDNVCQGHISASNETEAKNKFNSNKFDE